jgi:hypothetical protein
MGVRIQMPLARLQRNFMKTFTPILFLLVLTTACSSTYYSAMESLGVHKRDIMVERVEKARDAQQEGQEQFVSALEQFKSVVAVQPSELKRVYDKLNREYEDSQASAKKIRDRISSVEAVSEALFDEWEDELNQYTNKALRRDSEQKLRTTRQKYQQLIKLMKASEKRMEPVLSAMQDQVLYLKHNLNTRAIDSLRQEVISIDSDVDQLIAALQKSIAEANSFIKTMQD